MAAPLSGIKLSAQPYGIDPKDFGTLPGIKCDSSFASVIGPGQLIFRAADGNAELVTPGSSILGIVQRVTLGHSPLKLSYKPASTEAYIEFLPIATPAGNMKLVLVEDGVGGNINFPTNSFCNIAAQTYTLNSSTTLYENFEPRCLLDSSTAASSIGSLQCTIEREFLDEVGMYSRTSSQAKAYVVTLTSSLVQSVA